MTEQPAPDRPDRTRAKRSIRAMVDMALEYGGIRDLDDLVGQVAAIHQYRPYNALLVLLQRPGATFLLPPDEWRERFERQIRPGEQPIVMLQPGGPVMFQFDVSQTEPLPDANSRLPLHLVNPFGMPHTSGAEPALQWLTENAKRDGVRVNEARHGLGRGGCIWRTPSGPAPKVLVRRRPEVEADVRVRFETLVNAAFNPTERLATLAHELGHLYCGHLGSDRDDWWPDRRGLDEETEELEARATAGLVIRRLLPGTDLPRAAQPGTAVPPTGRSLEAALTAAGQILDMCRGFEPRRKPKAKPPG